MNSYGGGPFDVVGASEGTDVGSLTPDPQSFVLRALAAHLDKISAVVLANKDAPTEQVEYEVDASNLGAGGQQYHLPSGAAIIAYFIENNSATTIGVFAGASGGRPINSVAANTYRVALAPQQITSISLVPTSTTTPGLLRVVLTTAPLGPAIGSTAVAALNVDGGALAHVSNFPQLAVSKGAQPATGIGTQSLKDSGRTMVTLSAALVALGNVEGLMTFFLERFGSAFSPQTNYTVTTGKTLRVQSISLLSSNATAVVLTFNFRYNSSGSVTTASNLLFQHSLFVAANAPSNLTVPLPDGLEIPSGTTLGVGAYASTGSPNAAFTVLGFEY